MVDKIVTERSGSEEKKTEDSDLDRYIIDPKLDGVNIDKDKDGQPALEGVPAEFEEVERAAPKKKEKPKTAIVPEVVEATKETKAEEATRYKKILESQGFVLQEAREEGKVQYALEYGELRVGRTFSEGFPTGKFWARKDGNFLGPGDVKLLDIVKEFYAIRTGKKPIGKVVPKVTQAPSEKVVPYKNPAEIKREVGTMKLEKKGGYYNVAGHSEPDAALVQQYANEAGVDLKIISAEQNDVSAKAVIQAALNGQTVEAAVIHHFDTSRDVIALEVIESMQRKRMKPIEEYREDGRPILSQETNYRIYKRFIRFKNFAVRDAITKASRIATLKIANRDWREPEEIEAEVAEVRSVNSG